MRRMPSAGKLETLADLCVLHGLWYGDAVALIDAGESLSYAGLATRALQVGSVLVGLGVEPGDRVVLSGRNTVGWVSIAFGILLSGATVVPIGFANSDREREYVIAVTEPALALVDNDRDEDGGRWPVDCPQQSFGEVLGAADAAMPCHDIAIPPEGVALIMSTSGSTGSPKQVPMAHGQLLRLYTDVARTLGLTSKDRALGVVPLAHSFGFNGVLLSTLLTGGAVRLVANYDRDGLAELVAHERLTSVFGPPTILFDLVNSGRPGVALACHRAISGGSDVPLTQMRTACAHLGIPDMFVGYGLTEACGTVAIGKVTDAVSGSLPALTPVDGIEVKIIDDGGATLPAGMLGHIRCRGYNVFGGYLGDEQATGEAVDGAGWLNTGDVGSCGVDGRLSVTSRAKDTVIVSGFNVNPHEVEHLLLEDDSVAEAAVLGVTDGRQGQRLIACVIPTPGRTIVTERLIAHCRTHLTAYKVPRTFIELAEFPTTATGKRSRQALHEQTTRWLAQEIHEGLS